MYAQEETMKHLPIIVYNEYPAQLEKFIQEKKKGGMQPIFNFTPISDAFSPSLIDSGVTPQILEVLASTKTNFYVITKAGLPPEDVRNQLVKSRDYAQIIISAGLPDEDHRKLLEPFAGTLEERMEFAKFCISENIPVSGSAAPYLPLLGKEAKEQVMKRYADAGIEDVSVHLIKLSEAGINRVSKALGKESFLEEAFTKEESEKIRWTTPDGNIVDRYYVKKDLLAQEISGMGEAARHNGMTISVCKDVEAKVPGANDDAKRKGINCMAFRPR
jgi:DNA repair photolyase